MNRFDEIKDLLIRASEATSMFYHVCSYSENDVEQFWPSMKLYTKSGVLFFTDNTRKFAIIRYQIPGWNPRTDLRIIEEICNGDNFIWCESDKEDDEYCYTISLKNKFDSNMK